MHASSHNSELKIAMLALSIAISGCGGASGQSTSAQPSDTNQPVTVVNTPPQANAGQDQSVSVGQTVALSGSASQDADGDELSYLWKITTAPANSQSVLVNNASVSASITPDVEGVYTFILTVSDGTDSAQDEVVVNALQSSTGSQDITNAILVKSDASCAAYVGDYESYVIDIKRGLDFNGQVSITSNGSECTFAVNEIPNHDFNDEQAQFATNVSTQSASYTVPVSPAMSATKTEVEIGVSNGVFLNGVSVDIMAAACYGVGNEPLGREKIGCGANQQDHPWRYDPMSPLNSFGTDSHNAHPQPNGRYHYHGNPKALFNLDCQVVSPVIGFAADGFPIFGPCIEANGEVRAARASYQLKNNGGPRQAVSGYQTPQAGVGEIASNNYDGQFRSDWEYISGAGDLDECNGMVVNGQYGYYITDSYPWVVGCYRGQVNSSFRPSGQALDNLLHDHRHLGGVSHSH
ncbi:YHYH protein [Pseudoalteromonas sp. S16_S37]|uniref:YHYH protein n=1 Tax=Pseudoalteromonas sp. S16_S37 TaxID=2720228 RepID=UPI0016812195|nr:YHYH protein [Pseudoalteromonas sp. S16_S37]MBD1583031.1 YHYH protein [Pseudoalteromonas sp. S16_S37]